MPISLSFKLFNDHDVSTIGFACRLAGPALFPQCGKEVPFPVKLKVH